MKVDLVEADVGATKCPPPPARSLEPRRSAVLISGWATGPPVGVGDGLEPFLAARTPRFSYLYLPPYSPNLNLIERLMFHSWPRKV